MVMVRRARPAIVRCHFTGAALTYSLWSRGRLLGHSDLCWDTNPDISGLRCGFFDCAEDAIPLVDIVAAVHKAQSALDAAPDSRTAEADFVAAQDRVAALELELRDIDGRVLATSFIEIREDLCFTVRPERSFDDIEFIETLHDAPDDVDDLFECEPFETELANPALLDSFDDEPSASSLDDDDDDSSRYVLAVTFLNRADAPPITRA